MKKYICAAVLIIAVFSAFLACEKKSSPKKGPSHAEVIEEYRPDVEKKLAAIRWIGSELQDNYDTYAAAEEFTIPEAGLDLGIYGPDDENGNMQANMERNCIIISFERLQDLYSNPAKDILLDEGDAVSQAASMMKTGFMIGETEFPSYADTEFIRQFYLHSIANIDYLFVLRQLEYIPPEIEGSSSFNQGLYAGDLLLFEISNTDDIKYLGKNIIFGMNSDEVNVNTDDVEGWLHSDLYMNTLHFIAAVLKENFPNIKLRDSME